MSAIAVVKTPLVEWDAENQTFTFTDATVVIKHDPRTGHQDFYAQNDEGDALDLPDAAYELLLELLEHHQGKAS
jgi:hypothetical protein